ncbi:MAG: hypothetical protein ACJ76S_09065 [Solirubrobacteraceae bacterium]
MNDRAPSIYRVTSLPVRLAPALAALGLLAAATGPAAGSQGNAPAAPAKLRVAPGGAWSRHRDFTVSWTNPSHPKPIAVAYYRLCAVEAQRRCKDGKQRELDVHRLRLTVPKGGDYTVTVWLKDKAGHVNPRRRSPAVHLRFDDEPPTSGGLKRDAHRDPTRLELAVEDKLSGPGDIEVEMRPRHGGSWRSLSTSRDGTRTVRARIPDLELPDGDYEVHAVVQDRAGNRAVIGDGERQSMRIRLPLRERTSISGTLRHDTTSRSCRRVVTRIAGRPMTRTLCRYLAGHASVALPNPTPLTLGRAERPLVAGTAQGVPHGASLDVVERPRSAGAAIRTSRVEVDSSGRFQLWLEPGPSRTVELRYAGDRRTLPSKLAATVLVPAGSTLAASRRSVLNRQSVVFSGRLLGAPVPDIGRTVDLQAFYRGTWRTFATPRTDATGAWRYRYRFGATPGRVTYPFRLLIQRDAGYPYETGVSRIVRVSVRGR